MTTTTNTNTKTKMKMRFFKYVAGPTDPADAPVDSIRGVIYKHWRALGLTEIPNTGDNGVHASASPFEGLAERMNWLKVDPANDEFGAKLLAAGVSLKTIKEWSVDPQVLSHCHPIAMLTLYSQL